MLSNVFGFSDRSEDIKLMPHEIDLSIGTVLFAMPENFSKDMPAKDMIESINLADKMLFEGQSVKTLIRRW